MKFFVSEVLGDMNRVFIDLSARAWKCVSRKLVSLKNSDRLSKFEKLTISVFSFARKRPKIFFIPAFHSKN